MVRYLFNRAIFDDLNDPERLSGAHEGFYIERIEKDCMYCPLNHLKSAKVHLFIHTFIQALKEVSSTVYSEIMSIETVNKFKAITGR